MKLKRKLSIIFLTLVLCTTNIVTTFATDQNEINTFKPLQIDEIGGIYEKAGCNVVATEITKDKCVYDIELEQDGINVASNIVATKTENNETKLIITENGTEDELVYAENGEIYLNGELVKIENDISFEKVSLEKENLFTQTVGTRDYSRILTYAPYGSSTDYTELVQRFGKNIVVNQTLATMAVSTLIGIIMGCLFTPIAGAIAGGIASGIIYWYQANDPSAKSCSILSYKYVHRTNGFLVKPGLGVYKYTTKYYAYKYYCTYLGSKVRYQAFYY